MSTRPDFDVKVLGAGIVGRCLALALARLGLRVALQAGPAAAATGGADVRAYALNAASVALLSELKVWDALPAHAATAVLDMQVRGDARASAIEFSAWQQHTRALAWITDAAVLEHELAAAVRFSPHITVVDGASSTDAVPDPGIALTALCEGKHSSTREALGIETVRIDYAHQAIAARLTAPRPHRGMARQWFRAPDVLALLPFDTPEPEHSYALVWSLPNARAANLMALEPAAFERELVHATGNEVGELRLASARSAWPLTKADAVRWSGPGWVLLGDAAHTVHPLAGQGLNLGLADVAALVEIVRTREPWRDLGDERLLRRYARERAGPTWAMGQVTDGLLRLFAEPTPLVRELRNRSLTLVNRTTPLKRWLAARALGS